MCKADFIMNSKSEWNNARIPRVIIEDGDRQKEDDANGINRGKEKPRARQEKNRGLFVSATKRNNSESRDTANKKRKVEILKRESRDNKTHRENRRENKKEKERVDRERQKVIGVQKIETVEKSYWTNKLCEMAERSLIKREIPGAKEHMARIQGARENKQGMRKIENDENARKRNPTGIPLTETDPKET